MRARVVLQVARTAFREFVRTPEAVFWTYGFPLVMAVALGVAFSRSEPQPVHVVVAAEGEHAAALAAGLERFGDDRIDVETLAAEPARRALTRGNTDALVSGSVADSVVDVDLTRPQAEIALMWIERALARAAGRDAEPRAEIRPVDERGSRYIDFLIPGLIGLNLLGAGMWGIGFNVVNMRVRNTLRRLYVTPMAPAEFLSAFVLSRLAFVVPESLFVVLIGVLLFGVPVNGSIWLILLAVVAGGCAFSGLGLLVASRTKTIESISGLINLVMLPMWLLGGSFFSNERFPAWLQPVVQVMPLTHVNEVLREVMLGGAGLGAVWVPITALGAFAAVCVGVAVKVFRWT